MEYIRVFIVGGAICAIVQIFMDKTKLMPGRIMTMVVCLGSLLSAIGIYEPFVKWAHAGASVPLLGFGHTLYQTDNSYCIYSSNLIFIVIGILGVYTVFFVILFFLNTRNKPNIFVRIVASVFTNFINLIVRPFFVVISIVLINRPIVFLYYSNMIKPEYKTEEIIYTVLSLFFLIYGVVFAYIHIKYINNSFYFESLPFDYFSADEALMVMVIKIIIGFKITYDKIQGINEMSVMNLIIGLLLFVRTFNTFGNRKFIVNHVYLKNFTAFLSFFYCFYMLVPSMTNLSLFIIDIIFCCYTFFCFIFLC